VRFVLRFVVIEYEQRIPIMILPHHANEIDLPAAAAKD